MPRALSLAALALLAALLAAPPAAAQERCIPGLEATSNQDGSITLRWPPLPNATAYQVLVRPQGGGFTPLSPQVPPSASSFTYQPAVAADSYEFAVVALRGGSNQIGSYCHAVVARVPFFPTWTASVLGLGGALGGVSLLARRRPQ
jgi:hypothetical protein